MSRTINQAAAIAFIFGCFAIVVGFWITVIWTIVHFVHKFW